MKYMNNRYGQSRIFGKSKFNLQLLADETVTEGATGTEDGATSTEQNDDKSKPKYTDEDVDRIVARRRAEWQKQREKENAQNQRRASEAERLAQMTAEEQSNERLKAMEKRLEEYEKREARAEMTKQARAILLGENIHVGDELISKLIADDAESTKESVESFVTLFRGAVDAAVKEKLKSDTPKTGGASGMTKEQILAVANRTERQRLIKENMNLFK